MKVERVVKTSPYPSVCSLTRYLHNEATGKKTQHQTRRKEDAACRHEFISDVTNYDGGISTDEFKKLYQDVLQRKALERPSTSWRWREVELRDGTMTRNTNGRRGWRLLVWPNQSAVILWAELEGTVHSRPQRSVDLRQFCEEQRSKLVCKRLFGVIAAKRKFNLWLNPTVHFLFHLHCWSLSSELNTTCCLSTSVGWMKSRRHVTKVCCSAFKARFSSEVDIWTERDTSRIYLEVSWGHFLPNRDAFHPNHMFILPKTLPGKQKTQLKQT